MIWANQFSIALIKGYSTNLLVEIIKGIKDDIFAKVALKLGEGQMSVLNLYTTYIDLRRHVGVEIIE